MALDGAFLYAVKTELQSLIGGRVEKIHQPSREEAVMALRTKNGGQKLLFSINAGSARVHVTKIGVDNPNTPPMFCMLMRKHLTGGRLAAIRQNGLERILFFDFDCVDELGTPVTVTLVCEIMGRRSNLILMKNGRILDSLRRVDESMSRERQVLPGMMYELPPHQERLNFMTAKNSEIVAELEKQSGELSKSLIKIFEGISPLLAREWTFYAGQGNFISVETISDYECGRLLNIIERTKTVLLEGKCRYTVLSDGDGLLKEFSFIDIAQYGELMQTSEIATAFELLDRFFAERDSAVRMKQRANDLFRLLTNLTERTANRISNQREELVNCVNRDILKFYGDLISANMYRISKGDGLLVADNFYDENCPRVEIKLDKRKTPSQNAQHYYNEYKKMVTAEVKLAEQIAKGEEELAYLDSVFDSLSRATSNNDVSQLRIELAEQGYIRHSVSKAKPPKALPPIEYISSDGFTILVGRNNKQNDQLTLKFAEKSDVWLHTQSITGSHVIIVTDGEVPPDRTVEEAAIIAAVNSKGRNGNLVPVDYCNVKYVKKPSGAKPGKVIFSNYRTAFVKPDVNLANSLIKR